MFGFPEPPPIGTDQIGKIIEYNGKSYQLVLRVPQYRGGFLAIEVADDGKGHFGSPVVLVKHEPTAALDAVSHDRGLRDACRREWDSVLFRKAPAPPGMLPWKPAWDGISEDPAHPKDCRACFSEVRPLDGPFLDAFCPAHRDLIDAWYVEHGLAVGSWPPAKEEG